MQSKHPVSYVTYKSVQSQQLPKLNKKKYAPADIIIAEINNKAYKNVNTVFAYACLYKQEILQ